MLPAFDDTYTKKKPAIRRLFPSQSNDLSALNHADETEQ